ncbi:MFS transporter [Aestuariimicrobium kwangyangense]|uniref:MFS transporter n=1 Tax=Aestuariimicrobium kwangyangense TaxID=396389 RepID=UPI0004053AF6|nr:MFS transporter [Aestuariimicrobium kwangyangense]
MSTPTPSPVRARWVASAGMVVAIAVLAFNLRPLASAVGPVLPQLQADVHLTGATAGILTSLPTACFAVIGAVAPALARRFGVHRIIGVGLVAILVGSLARTRVSDPVSFLALSAVGLAGMALANVLAPSVVRRHFSRHVGLMTAVYSLTLSIGVAVSSAFTVPLSEALGGWRPAFLVWCVPVVVALVAWLPALPHDRDHAEQRANAGRGISLAAVARTRLGWLLGIFFGFQSAQAYSIFGWLPSIYIAAGLSQAGAGAMLGIATGLGIPLAFLWPAYMGRNPRPKGLLVLVVCSGAIGYLGLLFAPATLPWLWAALIALGTSSFPMILALFGMRARTAEGTAALSGFAQAVGYCIAILGPLSLGIVHDLTHGWFWPVALLGTLLLPMSVAGFLVVGSGDIEDELPSHPHAGE